MSGKQKSQDFLQHEQSVYDSYIKKAERAQKDGLLPDPVLTHRVGGLTVTARHPQLAKQLTAITASIRRLAPCYTYDSVSEHSTFCCQTWDNFQCDRHHQEALLALKAAVADCLFSLTSFQLKELVVNYRAPLYSRTTVIFPGAPRPAYVNLLLELTEKCRQKAGSDIKTSWGTHITAARFLRQVEAARASSFFSFMEEAPALGENKLERVDVAWVEANYNSLSYTVFQQFVLGQDGFRLVP